MEKQVERIFRANGGTVNMSHAVRNGITRHTLYSLLNNGDIVRLSRGVYRLASLSNINEPDIAITSLRFPKSVICLISALFFHKITTQIPHFVYVSVPRGIRRVKLDHPPIKVFNFSESSYNAGVEVHSIDGIKIKIYCPEKTIADCFKFRNKIGLEVALEALKLYKKQGGSDICKIMEFAKICRIENIIKPYMEISYESY